MKRFLLIVAAALGSSLLAPNVSEAGWRIRPLPGPVVVPRYYAPPLPYPVYGPTYVAAPAPWYPTPVYVAPPVTVVRTWW